MNVRPIKTTFLGAATVAALALAGCASTSPGYSGSANYPPPSSATCYDCGTVTRIDAVAGTGQTSGATGAVLGGVVGAAAGRALTDDESKGKQNTATVAGAVAGAVAGSAIQKNMQKDNASYVVYVRMDNGQTVTLNQTDISGISQGSYVRVYDGRAWPR
jgi:outer membrane lipoprotein SlyB